MLYESSTSAFRVYIDDPISVALQKISDNKAGCLICVSEKSIVNGVLTDGDIRRWMTQTDVIDISIPVREICNREFTSLPHDTPRGEIAKRLDGHFRILPLVDEFGHLVAIARTGHGDITIGKHKIGPSHPTFLIAEIGNNHNGDMDLAKRLIDLAVDAGADCAKFQMRDMSTLYVAEGDADDASRDLGAQYTLDLLAKYNLSKEQLFELFDYCQEKGLEPLCTPWDEVSLNALEEYGMQGYKLASADLTNHDLLRKMAQTGKTLICSTGMSSEAEIRESVTLLQAEGAPFVLLHCNSTYPAPYKDVHLNYMTRLGEIGGCPVGYSGHERGWFVPVASVSLGAKVIEKHFTVDRSMEGNDHKVSLLPEEFRQMVDAIRAT
ncbi:MAG: N-acetylneuraminate synthase family protein, partial [Maritimibacter sp.]